MSPEFDAADHLRIEGIGDCRHHDADAAGWLAVEEQVLQRLPQQVVVAETELVLANWPD